MAAGFISGTRNRFTATEAQFKLIGRTIYQKISVIALQRLRLWFAAPPAGASRARPRYVPARWIALGYSVIGVVDRYREISMRLAEMAEKKLVAFAFEHDIAH